MSVKHEVDARWFRIEFLSDEGEWIDAGDSFEDEKYSRCVKHSKSIDFIGHDVRIVEHRHIFFQRGKIIKR